ncbi:hypothetical protein [Anthocerotibacter panamensis]|uniref:hypothetical protein n=1 Tax=Anthocerotibacter panamensis TaxID=2857077 RepID=UPI001C4027A8|nr:hypothetical protein [Anthocerotibacter panamensis]
MNLHPGELEGCCRRLKEVSAVLQAPYRDPPFACDTPEMTALESALLEVSKARCALSLLVILLELPIDDHQDEEVGHLAGVVG